MYQMTSTIDSLLETAVAGGKFLGLSYVVTHKSGATIYSGSYGHVDFDREKPMTTDTVGWLASMSKLMTSVAVMHAVDKGLIGLDDDLSEILPELHEKEILVSFDDDTGAGEFVKSTYPITLRRALSHSSGLAYPPCDSALYRWATFHGYNMAKFHGNFAKDWDHPMISEPGVSWCYSTGIDWAGKTLEKVSNQTLEDYMRENIWSPLGMNRTTFYPEKYPENAMLSMGARENGTGSRLIPSESPYPVPANYCAGGAGIYSTANDYAKLLAALLQQKSVILNQTATEELVKPQLTPASRAALRVCRDKDMILPEIPKEFSVDHSLGGLYVECDIPDRRSKGSVCWDGLSSPHWLLDRQKGIAVVLFVQVMHSDEDTRRLWWELEEEVYKLAATIKTG